MVNSRHDAVMLIRQLMAQYNIQLSELQTTLNMPEGKEEVQTNLLQRILIYIGGAFIFVGICVYINMIWDDIPPLARVVVSLGSGFIAFIMGLISLSDSRFQKAATPLFLMGACLQPLGLFVFMDEYLPKSNNIAMAASFVFGFMLIQKQLAFWVTRHTSLLFFSVFFFYSTIICVLNWFDLYHVISPLLIGLSGLMVTWGIQKTRHTSITPFFYFISAFLTSLAAWDILENTSLDVLLIGVSAGLVYLAVLAASRTLLTVGVLSLLAFLGYYTDEYFKDIVGWPIALIVMGMMMIGISVYAVKLGKKIGRN
jgi:hypothetical protein